MKKFLSRYLFAFIMLPALPLILLFDPGRGAKMVGNLAFSFREMLSVLPPIFILIGLLDVWVSRETMVRYMGEGSGVKGVLLSFFLGSAAAGPLYAAFPIAGVFLKKGVSFTNLMIFLGAWSTTKIPMFLFELSAMGAPFAVTRLLVNIPVIIVIAVAMQAVIDPEEKERLYRAAEKP